MEPRQMPQAIGMIARKLLSPIKQLIGREKALTDEIRHHAGRVSVLEEELQSVLTRLNRTLRPGYIELSQRYRTALEAKYPELGNQPLRNDLGFYIYPERWVAFDQLPTVSQYAPTYPEIKDGFIGPQHRYYSTCAIRSGDHAVGIDVGISGYLQVGDALKIYELAYYADGPILELGTHNGLSTSVIAQAIHDSGNKKTLTTVDIDIVTNAVARSNLKDRPGSGQVNFNIEDATKFMDQLISDGRKFSFIFVDHWHGYDKTFEAATRVGSLLEPGGFCMFHDFGDPANFDVKHVYAVYQAVLDSVAFDPRFEFSGTSGCCAVFQFRPR